MNWVSNLPTLAQGGSELSLMASVNKALGKTLAATG
jgi:hypothetical protein